MIIVITLLNNNYVYIIFNGHIVLWSGQEEQAEESNI